MLQGAYTMSFQPQQGRQLICQPTVQAVLELHSITSTNVGIHSLSPGLATQTLASLRSTYALQSG